MTRFKNSQTFFDYKKKAIKKFELELFNGDIPTDQVKSYQNILFL